MGYMNTIPHWREKGVETNRELKARGLVRFLLLNHLAVSLFKWCARQELNLRPTGSKSPDGHTESQENCANPDNQQDSSKPTSGQ